MNLRTEREAVVTAYKCAKKVYFVYSEWALTPSHTRAEIVTPWLDATDPEKISAEDYNQGLKNLDPKAHYSVLAQGDYCGQCGDRKFNTVELKTDDGFETYCKACLEEALALFNESPPPSP